MTAPPATELVVVRHGETVWNLEGRQQGHLDSPLTALGVRQSEPVASALAGSALDAVYASDLRRAVQSADVIAGALALPVVTDPRLRERNLGVLESRTIAEFQREQPEVYRLFRSDDPDYVIPGGESARQRHVRCVACADEIARKHAGRAVLIVAHGGVLSSFMRHALRLSLSGPRRFSLFNGSINVFSVRDGEWRLVSWGDTRHLKGLGTLDDW